VCAYICFVTLVVPQQYVKTCVFVSSISQVPDLRTARIVSWQEKTALVLCDIMNEKTHSLVSVNPRSVLRKQVASSAATGFSCMAASELEYYMYEDTYRQAFEKGYVQNKMKATGDYLEDYHLFQTSREEKYTRTFMNHLKLSGIPVTNTKTTYKHTHNTIQYNFSCFIYMYL